MNERIRELSEQAQLYARQGMAKTVIELKRYDADMSSERYAKDFEEKFAELIVKDVFAMLKEAMLEGDDSKTDEIIDDRLQDAAGDVVDAYGIEDRIY